MGAGHNKESVARLGGPSSSNIILHSQAGTPVFASPHWGVAETIDPPEQDAGVSVATNLQGTVWHDLRALGLKDKIAGHRRLLREL